MGCDTITFVCGSSTLYTVKTQSIISGTENDKCQKPTVTGKTSDVSETNDTEKIKIFLQKY
jgi:hypothetical protein